MISCKDGFGVVRKIDILQYLQQNNLYYYINGLKLK